MPNVPQCSRKLSCSLGRVDRQRASTRHFPAPTLFCHSRSEPDLGSIKLLRLRLCLISLNTRLFGACQIYEQSVKLDGEKNAAAK